MLGVTLEFDLSWNDQITSATKAAACKLSFLLRSRRDFTPNQLLTLYKAPNFPCFEYGSHLWRGALKHYLVTLDAIQKRAIKLNKTSPELGVKTVFILMRLALIVLSLPL